MAVVSVEIPDDAVYLFEGYEVIPYDVFLEKMDEYYKQF